jgi:peroxin-14
MSREDLINSAVSFLQEPSVASAPLDKKIAFLQSKNLTQEEIDISLARAGNPSPVTATTANPTVASIPPSQYTYARGPPPLPGYGAYPGYWPPPPPPEVPRRDWRDWFIMATVMGGVGYGLYFMAKRYIIPLIAPPTTPQLEQDKSAIDSSFEKAFALLDQLQTDTSALKAAEESRTQRLDSALTELESVVVTLKEQDRRREDDARRNADEIRGLRDLIPQAIEAQKEGQGERLKELGNELKSLKTLVGNRMGIPATSGSASAQKSTSFMGGASSMHGGATGSSGVNGTATGSASGSSTLPSTSVSKENAVGASGTSDSQVAGAASSSSTAGPITSSPDRSQNATPSYASRFGSSRGGASIPAWQLAAGKKSQESLNGEKKDTSVSGTITETSPS